jgi:ABC-2 type transport system ATP-binding protein
MIQARDLTRCFGAFTAVSALTFEVPAGAILALLGPNGAGKTTTVRMLAALLAPSAGQATVAGYDVCENPGAVRASVGLVTDAPGLYEQMTVGDYLNLFGTIYGIPRTDLRRRVDGLIDFFELGPYRKQRLMGFSKGMKQKVALARALIHNPPILFLDEPTAGLDPLAARSVRELILSLKHGRRTIILCTHDLDEAERLADEVAIMREGRIVAYDSPTALRAQAAARSVQIELAAPSTWAVQALSNIAGVANPGLSHRDGAGPAPAAESEPVLLTYETADPRTVNPQVVAQLVALGAQVVSIEIATRSLEDVYASLMDSSQASQDTAELLTDHEPITRTAGR